MIDRYGNNESKRLLSRSERISKSLSKVPNKDIFATSQKEWSEVEKNIKALLAELLSVSGIGLAKATKILHLKRPNLFPVLDSFVIKFLLNTDISDVEKSRQLDIGLKARTVQPIAVKSLGCATTHESQFQREGLNQTVVSFYIYFIS